VPDEDSPADVLVEEQVGHILYMHVEIDGGAEQVRTVSEPGQGRTVDAVTDRLEQRRQPLPGPTATEGTADQNEIGDGSLLPRKAATGSN
jgi:hypothetical protein